MRIISQVSDMRQAGVNQLYGHQQPQAIESTVRDWFTAGCESCECSVSVAASIEGLVKVVGMLVTKL